jgi:hypothetical protein
LAYSLVGVDLILAPIFLSEPSLGDEPNDSDKDLMIGNIIPPARAVLLGVAGAKIRSTPTSER